MKQHPLRRYGFVLLTLAALAAAPAYGQAPGGAVTLERASAAYAAADFDTAIDLYSRLADDDSQDREVQKEALRGLSRSFTAKRMEDEARTALVHLVELEPPIVELDPNAEPPPLMQLYYDVRRDLTDSYVVEQANPAARTLAVMDFSNNSFFEKERFDAMEAGFAALLIQQLSGTTDLKVVERERIQWLLNELDLQRDAARVDQATAVQMGKIMGAHVMLFGSFIVADKRRVVLSARLVDVSTSEVLMAEQVDGRMDDFVDLVGKLSGQLARAINVELADASTAIPDADLRGPNSLEAMLAFSRGLDLQERGDWAGAHAQFRAALEHDPGYTRARLKAESLQPLLASR